MSLVAYLVLDRSDRIAVNRPATLRDPSNLPIDIVVDNLSGTGCLFLVDSPLRVGDRVSVGIPGVGIRDARISRAIHPQYACAFFSPVDQKDIDAALSVETLVTGIFPERLQASDTRGHGASVRRPAANKFPRPARVAVILGTSILMWSGILLALTAVVG